MKIVFKILFRCCNQFLSMRFSWRILHVFCVYLVPVLGTVVRMWHILNKILLWTLLRYVKVLVIQRLLCAKEVEESSRCVTTLTDGLTVTLIHCLQPILIASVVTALLLCGGPSCEHTISGCVRSGVTVQDEYNTAQHWCHLTCDDGRWARNTVYVVPLVTMPEQVSPGAAGLSKQADAAPSATWGSLLTSHVSVHISDEWICWSPQNWAARSVTAFQQAGCAHFCPVSTWSCMIRLHSGMPSIFWFDADNKSLHSCHVDIAFKFQPIAVIITWCLGLAWRETPRCGVKSSSSPSYLSACRTRCWNCIQIKSVNCRKIQIQPCSRDSFETWHFPVLLWTSFTCFYTKCSTLSHFANLRPVISHHFTVGLCSS